MAEKLKFQKFTAPVEFFLSSHAILEKRIKTIPSCVPPRKRIYKTSIKN